MPDGKRCGPSLIAKQEEAERAGFEPAVRFDPHTAFPVPHLRPLGHLSGEAFAAVYPRRAVSSTYQMLGKNALDHPDLIVPQGRRFGKKPGERNPIWQ